MKRNKTIENKDTYMFVCKLKLKDEWDIEKNIKFVIITCL